MEFPSIQVGDAQIITGDCRAVLRSMPDKSVQTCITSPPYFALRDYDHADQIGLETTPAEFVAAMVDVFNEVRRVLKDDGTLWLNLGDTYATNSGGYTARHSTDSKISEGARKAARKAKTLPRSTGLKPKDLIGIPWRVAFALQEAGWYLRQDIIWHKPNPMPESVNDRCTKAHEYIFLLTKSERYYYDAEAIKEPASRNTNPRISNAKAEEIRAQRAAGANTQVAGSGRSSPKIAETGGFVKANVSFDNAVCLLVENRNKRSVWTVGTRPLKEDHFAAYPVELIEPCVLAGSPRGGVVLDPFGGAGTTALAAVCRGRKAIMIEVNPTYADMAARRIERESKQRDIFHHAAIAE